MGSSTSATVKPPLHQPPRSEKLWPRCTNPPPIASSFTVCRPNLVVEALPDSLTSTTVLTTSRKTRSDSGRSELASLKKSKRKLELSDDNSKTERRRSRVPKRTKSVPAEKNKHTIIIFCSSLFKIYKNFQHQLFVR